MRKNNSSPEARILIQYSRKVGISSREIVDSESELKRREGRASTGRRERKREISAPQRHLTERERGSKEARNHCPEKKKGRFGIKLPASKFG